MLTLHTVGSLRGVFITPSQHPKPPMSPPAPSSTSHSDAGGGLTAIPHCIYSVGIADIFFVSPVKPREESLSECKFKALSYLSSDQ